MTNFEYKVKQPYEIQTNDEKEKDWIGNTFFVGENGNKFDKIVPDNYIIVLNFPGSGMALSTHDEEKLKKDAQNASNKTKELFTKSSDIHVHVFTAVYENKADLLIHKYNTQDKIGDIEETCNPVKDIFNKTIALLLSENYYQTEKNLKNLFLRGHCFGCVVISQLEHLLKEKLEQNKFDKEQVKHLLSIPKAFISSPALSLQNYPQHFKTIAIVNISDKTIANKRKKDTPENIWRRNLKTELEKATNFTKDDMLPFEDTKDVIQDANYKLPDIKVKPIKNLTYSNVDLYISNRGNFPQNFYKLKESIKKRIGQEYTEETFDKQVKKWLKGHEYIFLPKELTDIFEQKFQSAYKDNIFNEGINNLQNLDNSVSITNDNSR